MSNPPIQTAQDYQQHYNKRSQVFLQKIEMAINEADLPIATIVGLLTMLRRDYMEQVARMNQMQAAAQAPDRLSPALESIPGTPIDTLTGEGDSSGKE